MLQLITNIKGPKGDKGLTGDPSTWIKTGTGFPEGVVTAPVGTTYIDTAATNGAQQWIKKTGTNSYGWEVSVGDTGPRDITALIKEPIISGNIYIQRSGDGVTLTFKNVVLPTGSSYFEFFAGSNPIPTGFAKQLQRYRVDEWMGSKVSSTIIPAWMTWFGYNSIQWLGTGMTAGGTRPTVGIDGAFAVTTIDSWPSTLPGDPA